MRIFLIQDSEAYGREIELPFKVENIEKVRDLDFGSINSFSIFLIYTDRNELFENTCKKIRNNPNPHIYLSPIVLLETEKHFPKRLKTMADVVVNLNESNKEDINRTFFYKIDKIHRSFKDLNIPPGTKDNSIILKVVRYIYTRDKKAKPVRDSSSIYGLSYPYLETFLTKEDASIFNVLDLLEDRKFLFGEFFEKVHFCNRCFSAFLNFMETCVNCGSGNLSVENLIHHFTCAYVGPEEDFMEGNILRCPKCRKELKGLGVDFDRPTIIYKCNNCGFVSQDTHVKAICFHCEKESEPEDLILRTIKNYELTALGENIAIYGMESLFFTALKERVNILQYETFLAILKLEIERCKRYRIKSSLIAFQIKNINDLYERLGKRATELLKEISIIIQTITRKSDVISMLNESLILILLPHTPKEGATMVLSRLKENINQLISSNIDMLIEIGTGFKEIPDVETEPDVFIENLLEKMEMKEN